MITIKEVAKKSGVSIGTVDRVVHKRGRVAKKTAVRVERIIRQFGYKPNIFASRLSTSRFYHFAVFMPDLSQDSGYWKLVARGIDRAREELKSYHVKIDYFCYDRYSEKSIQLTFERLLQTKTDGTLMAPVPHGPMQSLLHSVPEYMPYVFFDATVPGSRAVTFIGQDSYQGGMVAAQLMHTILHDTGSVAVILAVAGDPHINKRAEGFQSFFKDKTVPVHRYTLETTVDLQGFHLLLDSVAADHPDIKGIFVTNAATHFVASHLRSKGSGRKVFLIGYDLIDANVRYLKEGVIDFLISQNAQAQGYEGIHALYRHVILRQPCEKNIMMPIDIITKENLVYYHRY